MITSPVSPALPCGPAPFLSARGDTLWTVAGKLAQLGLPPPLIIQTHLHRTQPASIWTTRWRSPLRRHRSATGHHCRLGGPLLSRQSCRGRW